MANTYFPIATTTVGSGGAATIEFTSIPQTYTDLLLKLSFRSSAAGAHGGSAQMIFNNSTAQNYSFTFLRGSGFTSPGTGTSAGVAYIRVTNNHPTAGNTASTFGNSDVYIYNYTSSSAKSTSEDSVEENNTSECYAQITAGVWTLTNAITSIKLTSEATSFVQYSTATLYGIKKN